MNIAITNAPGAMKSAVITGVFALMLCAGSLHAERTDEPIRRGDTLIFPEGAAIPRSLTDVEQRYLEQFPLAPARDATPPPDGPVHCAAEYEPMEALFMAYEGAGSWKDILDTMAAHVTTTGDADVIVFVDYASEADEVAYYMDLAGADMDRVHTIIRTTDSIWIRDYGPRYIYQGDVRNIVDHTYNRPRPWDNQIPGYYGNLVGHEVYEIPLVHGGGNFHLNALGESNVSRLINAENPEYTEQEIHDLWFAFQNVDTTFFDPLPSYIDSTQHIDMWMQVIADDAIIISDWPENPGSTQDDICDDAAQLFENRGYTVTRVPAKHTFGTHYTYTNVVMCNDLVMIPRYTNSQVEYYNDDALSAWQSALPDRAIVQIDSESIVGAAGVLHCIVMHKPAHLGGEDPTAYLQNPRGGEIFEPGENVTINWLSDDDIAVDNVDVLFSTDSGQTFEPIVVEFQEHGSYPWTVPDIATTQGRIRVVVRDDDGRTGHDESDSDFTINGTPIIGDLNGDASVDVADLLILLAAWGDCGDPCPPTCPADITGPNGEPDCMVNVSDLLLLLSNWG